MDATMERFCLAGLAWPVGLDLATMCHIRILTFLHLSRGRSDGFDLSWRLLAEIRRSRTNSRRSTTFRRRVWPSQPYMSRSPSCDFLGFGQIWSRPPLAPTQISTPGVVFRRSQRDFGLSGLQLGLRFGPFAITRRGLTHPLDGFGLKRLEVPLHSASWSAAGG